LERYEQEDSMDKQEENQGDQANQRLGRARRSRTRSISDVKGMFADLTAGDAAQQTAKKESADPHATISSEK
jgi:hypothetical protein